MDGSINFLYFLKEISTVKEQLDGNQNKKLKKIRNSVSDEFEKYDEPSETVLNYIDQLLVVNERNNCFNKRRELSTRSKLNNIWRFLIDELKL